MIQVFLGRDAIYIKKEINQQNQTRFSVMVYFLAEKISFTFIDVS